MSHNSLLYDDPLTEMSYEILFMLCFIESPVLKTEFNGRGDPLRWPHDNLYLQKLALTSLTNGGRSVGIVRLRTTTHGV
jgi:hypothetical protein